MKTVTDVKASESEEEESSTDNEFSWPDQHEVIDFEQERLHRKQRLAAGLRVLGRLGSQKVSLAISPSEIPNSQTASGSTRLGKISN